MTSAPYDRFVAAVAPELRSRWTSTAIDVALDTARATSGLELCELGFAEFLAARVAGTSNLSAVSLGDLHVVFGCSVGHRRAIDELARRCAAVCERLHLDLDLRGALLEHLLTAKRDGRVRLLSYRGTGPLDAWLDVVAARWVIDAERTGQARSVPVAWVPGPAFDPELDYLRGHYRELVEQALREALARLDARSRKILRQYYGQGLSAANMAAMYGQHRTVIHRRIVGARRAVLDAVLASVRARTQLGCDEVASVIRWVAASLRITGDRFWVAMDPRQSRACDEP